MNCGINLLPDSCHNARQRASRRNVWTVTALAAALLAASAWAALHAADRAISRRNHELAALHVRQAELDRQLTLAAGRRNRLADQARALAALRQNHPLPQQLLTLTRDAPDGIVLAELRAGSALPSGAPRPRSAARAHLAAAEPRRPTAGSDSRRPVVHMSGYAVDHDELKDFIDVVQRVPNWEGAELLRAAREPQRAGTALAFQLQCQPREGVP